ncbi:MAG: hypothetical protein P4M01_12150 [Acidobacteriota bacterium]|nr:hypothetical protein [Acidobacteriota bacterium]
MLLQDLTSVHDDMQAFAQGVGLRRFPGYIPDEMPSVLWEGENNGEGWKDFMELARASGAAFLTISTQQIDADDVDLLLDELQRSSLSRAEDMESARQLRHYYGRIGHVQIGFPHHGVMFLCELTTEWYESYKVLQEMADDLGGLLMGGASEDESEEDER